MIFPCFARDYIEVLIMGFMNKQSPTGHRMFCCLMEFHGDEMIGTPERNGISRGEATHLLSLIILFLFLSWDFRIL